MPFIVLKAESVLKNNKGRKFYWGQLFLLKKQSTPNYLQLLLTHLPAPKQLQK